MASPQGSYIRNLVIQTVTKEIGCHYPQAAFFVLSIKFDNSIHFVYIWIGISERDNVVGAGRPTKYKEEYNDQVFKLCLLGATDREVANFFDVDEATVNRWKIEYPEFCESIKRGKIQADTEIAESLYNKAKGYTRDEVKIFQYEGEPVIVPYKAYYPPDTAAINIWLKNRRGKVKDEDGQRWADKHEIDHTTKGESIKPLDTSKLTLEEKQILLKAIRSQKDGGD